VPLGVVRACGVAGLLILSRGLSSKEVGADRRGLATRSCAGRGVGGGAGRRRSRWVCGELVRFENKKGVGRSGGCCVFYLATCWGGSACTQNGGALSKDTAALGFADA